MRDKLTALNETYHALRLELLKRQVSKCKLERLAQTRRVIAERIRKEYGDDLSLLNKQGYFTLGERK